MIPFTKEHCLRISLALKGKPKSMTHCENMRHPSVAKKEVARKRWQDPYLRQKMSEWVKKSITPERREIMTKNGAKNKGHKDSIESRKLKSIAIKKLWQNPLYRQKMIRDKKNRGISEENKKKMFDARRIRICSVEVKQKISTSNKLFWENHPEKREEVGKRNRGKKLSSEHKAKFTYFGRKHTTESKQKISDVHKGKMVREETRRKLRQYCGQNASGWMGGKSFEPYTPNFHTQFKRMIRERDSHCCQLCHKHQSQLKRTLAIHHIDYNKLNSFTFNCISLCNICHSLTNNNRGNWKSFFQNILHEKYKYSYTINQRTLPDEVNQNSRD